MENIRFYVEEKYDENFSKKIAGLGDIYINECFSVSHRDHSVNNWDTQDSFHHFQVCFLKMKSSTKKFNYSSKFFNNSSIWRIKDIIKAQNF